MSDSNYLNEWRYVFVPAKKIDSVLITSDGISSDLLQGREQEFADELLNDLKREKLLKDKKAYIRKMIDNWPVPKHTDDKTVVVMEAR